MSELLEYSHQTMSGKIRQNKNVSSAEKNVMNAQMNLIYIFEGVCRMHGLRCYMMYETLLGAVYRRGFMEGMKSVSLAMMRPDYERMKGIMAMSFPEGAMMHLLTAYTKPCINASYAKFVDMRTATFESDRFEPQGVWINIFPLDAVPDGTQTAQKAWESEMYLMMKTKTADELKKYEKMALDVFEMSSRVNFFFHEFKSAHEPAGRFHAGSVMKAWFGDPVELPFETMKFPAPVAVDKVLDATYGGGWQDMAMKLESRARHVVTIDAPRHELNEGNGAGAAANAIMDAATFDVMGAGDAIEAEIEEMEREIVEEDLVRPVPPDAKPEPVIEIAECIQEEKKKEPEKLDKKADVQKTIEVVAASETVDENELTASDEATEAIDELEQTEKIESIDLTKLTETSEASKEVESSEPIASSTVIESTEAVEESEQDAAVEHIESIELTETIETENQEEIIESKATKGANSDAKESETKDAKPRQATIVKKERVEIFVDYELMDIEPIDY